MAFEFSVGPRSTTQTIAQIAQLIERTGNDKKFMSFSMRLNTGTMGKGSYGDFLPTAETDPYASTRRKPDWTVGWRWGNSVTNSMGMTLNQGWQIVFEVFDEGASRTVQARARGAGGKGDVRRFADMVLGTL